MELGLEDRRVLVTGASRGIGRTIAEMYAREGAALAICARNAESVREAESELRAAGAKVYAEAVDVSDPTALRGFVSAAAAAMDGLDVVVSNASPGSVTGDDAWEISARGDLRALAILAEAATPYLEKSDMASIVAISSTSAFDTDFPSGPTAFAAMKAAILQHAGALARSLAPKGIRVNTVSPGPILFEGGAWDAVRSSRPEVFDKVLDRLPLGRFGRREEVADAVAFLTSARASYCTGVNLVVDGGMLSRVQH